MFKFFKIFILFSIVFGCSQNETTTINPCSTSPNIAISNPDDFELCFEAIRTIKNNASDKSVNGLMSIFITSESERNSLLSKLIDEKQKYISLGFDNYVNDFYIKNQITLEYKNYYINLKNNLTSHFATNPSLQAFISFIGNEKSIVNNSSLCISEKQNLLRLLNQLQGFGQFYYKHYYTSISTRDCNFFESILCKLVASTATVLYNRVQMPYLFAAEVVLLSRVDGYPVGLSTLMALNETAEMVYNWCCNKEEVPLCAPPTGSMILTHGCNDFTYSVVGPGNYTTTVWTNVNTSPSFAVTSTPSLRFTVPTLSTPSRMVASITCLDENGISTFPWNNPETFSSANTTPPSIQWGQSPPSTAAKGPTYNISAISGTSGPFVLSFSVTPFGGIVTSSGPWGGNLIFFDSGTKTVTATLTNTCTGVASSVSKTVNVQ